MRATKADKEMELQSLRTWAFAGAVERTVRGLSIDGVGVGGYCGRVDGLVRSSEGV